MCDVDIENDVPMLVVYVSGYMLASASVGAWLCWCSVCHLACIWGSTL
jgi:hypothetical protein